MMKTAFSLALVLFAACTSSDDGDVRTSAPTVASAPTQASPVNGDWRARVAADIAAMKQTAPQSLADLQALRPSRTRAGHLRFTSTLPADPRATSVLLDRLLHGAPDGERAALVEALPRTTGAYADALVDLYDSEPIAEVRSVYVFAAKRAPDALALRVIQHGLADRDPAVQAEAARVAAGHSVGAQVANELRAALAATAPEVRAEAARALGILGVAAARAELLLKLEDADPDVRLEALRALDRVAPGTVPAATLAQLSRDADTRIARLAVKLADTAAR